MNGGTDADVKSRMRRKERKRKRKDSYATVKTGFHKRKLDGSGDGRNGRFPFSSVYVSASVTYVAVKTEHNLDGSTKKKSLMLVFALPSWLCLRQARFHGDTTDTKEQR